jgi:hypothetical protein
MMNGLPLSKVYQLLEQEPVVLLTAADRAPSMLWPCPGI